MTEVTRTIRSPFGDVLDVLKVLCSLGGTDITRDKSEVWFEQSAVDDEISSIDSDAVCSLVVSTYNTFRDSTSRRIYGGLIDCAMAVVRPESGLWGDEESEGLLIADWAEKASDELLDICLATGDGDGDGDVDVDEGAKAAAGAKIQSFVGTMEGHLSAKSKEEDTDQVYLVGESATAADVLTCLLLSKAMEKSMVGGSTSTSIPVATASLLSFILSHPMVTAVLPPTTCSTKSVTKSDTKSDSTASATALPYDASFEPFEDEENLVLSKLREMGKAYDAYAHPACTTAEELVSAVSLPAGHVHTKNLFLRDKKHGLFLVSVLPDKVVDTKKLGKEHLKLEGKVNLRIADAALLQSTLGVEPGCVGPLSVCHNGVGEEASNVTLVLDAGLLEATRIHSHPLRNDVSVSMAPTDLLDAVGAGCGRTEPVIVEFATKDDGDAPPAAKSDFSSKEKEKAITSNKSTSTKSTTEKAPPPERKKGETLLKLQWKKKDDFPNWYSDVIVLSEMISYYDISGCYILRPWSYKIWELMQEWFNEKIFALGVENCYFPLFVSKERLEVEKDHVEGFAPEVAWVTRSGEDGELAKPIAVRPTSETIMYPAYSDWIQSHRDLPLKLNQWSNVVRWEFKVPTPFLRSREFLWQEGHTAHATHEEATEMMMDALDIYTQVYRDLLAIPVVPGYKTEKEKFAGGHRTTTVEAYIPTSGRAIQGATSHDLGQNFGKMFDISFQDTSGKTEVAWQTSWGLTTRTIGVMVMVHGDDTGLVLPPRVAPLQAVVVPITGKDFEWDEAAIYCAKVLDHLKSAGIRVRYDDRRIYKPGWKYNHWEQKGVPVRIEVGPRDAKAQKVTAVVRRNGSKSTLDVNDQLGPTVQTLLTQIQDQMLEAATHTRDQHLVKITQWKDFVPNLEKGHLVLTPWCGGEHQDWEEWVKEKSREESLAARGEEQEDARTATSVAAKTLCIPFTQDALPEDAKCFASGLPAVCWCLWGRSY